MAKRTTTVTHPDGTVSKRTSQRATYTHAVVLAATREHRVAGATRALQATETSAAKFDAAIGGRITETSRPVGRSTFVSLYVGGQFATLYVTGRDERPTDDEVRAKFASLRDAAHKYLANHRERLAAAEQSPEVTYEVLRWSSREDLARKAAEGEFARSAVNGNRVYVVPVD